MALGAAAVSDPDADSDGDGVPDREELRRNSNPLDPADRAGHPYVVRFEVPAPSIRVNASPTP